MTNTFTYKRKKRKNMRIRNTDLRRVWTEAGTLIMLIAVAEGSLQMSVHAFERAVYMNASLECSKGLALTLIFSVIVSQLVCSIALLVPHIYYQTGSFAPSILLASTLWFEALLFGDLTDAAVATRSAAMTVTALMLALFRYDRQARNSIQQLPTSSWVLTIEQKIRTACSVARAGSYFPVLAIVLLFWGVTYNPFWRSRGIVFEYYRSRFQAALSTASTLMLVSGQDTKGLVLPIQGWRRIQEILNRMFCARELQLGRGKAI